MARYDAVLIPGGGVRERGRIPPWVAARLDRALAISGNPFLIPASAGTPHRPPPLDSRGFPIFEARAMAQYLLDRGADAHRILMESSSYDTIGNAYFSRVVHVIPRSFERILVITSQFHITRTEKIFRWVYALPGPGRECSVSFESVPDTGIEESTLAARQAKELASLARFESVQARIVTLAHLHQWLFSSHAVYARTSEPTSDPAVDSSTY